MTYEEKRRRVCEALVIEADWHCNLPAGEPFCPIDLDDDACVECEHKILVYSDGPDLSAKIKAALIEKEIPFITGWGCGRKAWFVKFPFKFEGRVWWAKTEDLAVLEAVFKALVKEEK